MKALVYHGPGQRGWDSVEDPRLIDPTDIIVRVDTTTICGTDLHILKGDVPETGPGTILGHEAVGTVEEVGPGVSRCRARRSRAYVMRELVRALPVLQGGTLWPVPRRRRLDLRTPDQRPPSRVCPRSVRRHVGLQGPRAAHRRAGPVPGQHPSDLLRGRGVERHGLPGDLVAIVGAGPIGLAAILTARLYTPGKIVAIDLAAQPPRKCGALRRRRDDQQQPRGCGGRR